MISGTSWFRHPKHLANVFYLYSLSCSDLSPLLILLLLRDGNLVKCEIYGEVEVNSNLSGLPDLTLLFANPSIFNDVRFHPCVRLRPWEANQILSFVPPDGQFTLMSYRFAEFHYAHAYQYSFFTVV